MYQSNKVSTDVCINLRYTGFKFTSKKFSLTSNPGQILRIRKNNIFEYIIRPISLHSPMNSPIPNLIHVLKLSSIIRYKLKSILKHGTKGTKDT